VSSLVPGSTGWRGGRHHKDAAIADPAAIAIFVPHWCWDDTHMQEPNRGTDTIYGADF